MHKYSFKIADSVVLRMPIDAVFLKVDCQHPEEIDQETIQSAQNCLWALVDPTKPLHDYTFRIAGTGQSLPDDFLDKHTYVGTFFNAGRLLVWHMFWDGTCNPVKT